MKTLTTLFLCLYLTGSIAAHCGSCGVGSAPKEKSYTSTPKQTCSSCHNKRKNHHGSKSWKKKHEDVMPKLNLSKSQQKKYNKLRSQYVTDIQKTQSAYSDNLEKLFTKKQYKTFIKMEEAFLDIPID
ncbi:hypothetical protein OAJ27_01835 [bacterium]|nr:hypothetical protein [bacterium]